MNLSSKQSFCQNDECPTPKIALKDCMFCFTKLFSERKKEDSPKPTKTKFVNRQEAHRIKPVKDFFSDFNESATTSRIPSNEQYIINEEIEIWNEIFSNLKLTKKKDIGKIKSFSTIISNQGRILNTSEFSFYVSFHKDQDHRITEEQEIIKMITGDYYNNHNESVKDLTFRGKNWIQKRFQIELDHYQLRMILLRSLNLI